MPKLKENEKQIAGKEGSGMKVPCCPDLEKDKGCDYLDFHYRLLHMKTVLVEKREYTIPVEVLIKARLQRCPGPMALGDLVYSTTLFPGERVRLFTMDRRSKFSFDSETSLSYRHEQSSEERYYMSTMSHFMSNLTTRDFSTASSHNSSSFSGGGETSGVLGTLLFGADVDVSGSHSGSSTRSFLREMSQHSEAAHNSSVQATRASNSISIGEVQSRTHKEGETESHYESSSRVFSNPNKCHAITYLFYQIAKTQIVRFEIVSVERRIVDPAGDTRVNSLPPQPTGNVSVIPDAILATNKNRLDIEATGRQSVSNSAGQTALAYTTKQNMVKAKDQMYFPTQQQPIPDDVQEEALKAVGDDLARSGLVEDKTYQLTEESRREFSFKFRTSIPTAGVIVKGCLDKCDTCETGLQKEMILDLERKQLENELLKRQIELLDKSQEYRCCPEEFWEEDIDED